ncbi:XrtN system VIT domain-containing protein [Flavobacterium sp. KACC 22761]|uniref:XrtN system VIT domain-containing protein n=1 Tax=Flavobacterium sp. KACC 22761 TaxID=3092665 RepID=UPI002A760AFA|nr:XrtN system VIT domain-containing protein [Flavobacterium sp. KACC 22761]WPO76952.1 XrtN system VIT domain-containing protein [Flavobacterium sp. KACC 22761]
MKYKTEILDYYQKPGVQSSLVVTIFSTIFMICSLTFKKLSFNEYESIGVVSLMIEFLYGTLISFSILKNKNEYVHLIPFLMLNWLIGCFSLNVFIPVFQDLPIWVYVTTFIFCFTNFILYQDFIKTPRTFLFYFINGISFWIIFYFALYLIPLTPFSFIGILALGMGFYGLVPGIILIIHLLTVIVNLSKNRIYFLSFTAGFGLVLVGFSIFTIGLVVENNKIIQSARINSFNSDEDLPRYISVSQNLKPNFFNEILLKKDIVYFDKNNFFSFDGFDSFSNQQFNKTKIHNPFISIAYWFCEDSGLTNDDKINILKSNFDKRLETEEQLWSGENVLTKAIKEDVKLYPNTRLAYTEITMDIASDVKAWNNQEAIYSFQLPEGSVATSLSLWVNGIERKGVLTTKEKAKKAYKQIVGVEYRDPSLLQWREGNKVVVRVFPVNKQTPRKFKCGFTTPLKVEDNILKYQSLSTKGPNISNAKTISRIQTVGNTAIETSKDFELEKGFFINQSTGLDEWDATMPLPKINSQAFVWKNKVYEIQNIQKTIIPFTPSEIILDLNDNWTTKQIEAFINLNQKNLYVFVNGKKTQINAENFKAIQLDFENYHYSLLPLYQLAKNTLIITKSGTFSANFEELEDSNYLKEIKTNTTEKNIKVINISTDINPFWQTVKEQKYVDYFQCSLDKSLNLIKKQQFPSYKTDENSINIEPAQISIHENIADSTSKSNGPNHIYRMYAFGKVLEEQVKIKNDTLASNQYVELAKDANIVTPISSLIVLETDEDYAKNGIEKNVNTLGNASINNDGSVPEPHEWLLIIIGISALYFYYRKNKKQLA